MKNALLRRKYVYLAALVSAVMILTLFAPLIVAGQTTLAPPSQIEAKGTVLQCSNPALPGPPPVVPGTQSPSPPCIVGIQLGSHVEINFHDFVFTTASCTPPPAPPACSGGASGTVKIEVGNGGEATLTITTVFTGPGGFGVIATVSMSSISGLSPGDTAVVDVVLMRLAFGIGTGVNPGLTTVTAGSLGGLDSLDTTAND